MECLEEHTELPVKRSMAVSVKPPGRASHAAEAEQRRWVRPRRFSTLSRFSLR